MASCASMTQLNRSYYLLVGTVFDHQAGSDGSENNKESA
jgi:hypothetical protein